MPRDPEIKTVLVIGSGPIIIGQAAEFDYAGTQACKSLRSEGVKTVLVNSNPATIMTDMKIADVVYIEPLTVEFLEKIIAKERPDGLLPTLGGQTGLNLAVELHDAGVLDKYGVKFLGTPLKTIRTAEDRLMFKELMQKIGEPVPASAVFNDDVDAVLKWGNEQGYPLIVRPAYTLGGTGGGIAYNREDLKEIAARGFHFSPIKQVLIETSVIGWKEVEYEVMRDSNDNCITICNMENIDPMGVHTGDSVVVAPSQTLSDYEYQMLRTASINIIRALKIEGGCNVQLALDPDSFRYFVIEVNPRVSRSSALASKATGYPIAKVAAKIAIGLRLDEIINEVTGATCACFEPALDYLVMKLPRWPFDKFHSADRRLGTQMKATGEVMAIGRSFESSLMKAIRSLEIKLDGLYVPGSDHWGKLAIEDILKTATDERLFVVLEGLRRGYSIDRMHQLTGIDRWFLDKFQNIINKEKRMMEMGPAFMQSGDLELAKRLGFSDEMIASAIGMTQDEVRAERKSRAIEPTFKMVDTCAAEFAAETPYYYSSYDDEDEVEIGEVKKVIVLGSGPIRIGQGVEFDYCSVHSALALREIGFQSLIINNNPETVSTDFDTSDRLYFEPLTVEDVLNVIEREKADGVIVQFGGQTAINLSVGLARRGIKIYGTDIEGIQLAEDRERFDNLLGRLKVKRPAGGGCYNFTQARRIAHEIGYPVLVRPSFVIGGQSMEICRNDSELKDYMVHAVVASGEHPVLVDHYIEGSEVEVDLISDGETVVIPGIMEHIERAGIHSGDSMAVYPPQNLSQAVIDELEKTSIILAKALGVRGVLNIQFIVSKDDEVYVLEVNPRASRTIPFLSKVTGIPMVYLGTVVCMGKKLRDLDYRTGIIAEKPLVAVKAPVFSFSRLNELDIDLGPQMKSTGEIMGVDRGLGQALYKALLAAGIDVPHEGGNLLITVADRDKEEAIEIARRFTALDYNIWATTGTADRLEKEGIPAIRLVKISEGTPNPLTTIQQGACDLLINTLSANRKVEEEGAMIRKASVERSIPCFTSLDTARAMLYVLRKLKEGHMELNVHSLREILGDPE